MALGARLVGYSASAGWTGSAIGSATGVRRRGDCDGLARAGEHAADRDRSARRGAASVGARRVAGADGDLEVRVELHERAARDRDEADVFASGRGGPCPPRCWREPTPPLDGSGSRAPKRLRRRQLAWQARNGQRGQLDRPLPHLELAVPTVPSRLGHGRMIAVASDAAKRHRTSEPSRHRAFAEPSPSFHAER